jgi:hypothetical protein
MEHDDDLAALPLIDNLTVKDVFSEFYTGPTNRAGLPGA